MIKLFKSSIIFFTSYTSFVSLYISFIELNGEDLILSEDTFICPGESTIITVSSTDDVAWNVLGLVEDTEVSPEDDQTYFAEVSNAFGCTTYAEVEISIYS